MEIEGAERGQSPHHFRQHSEGYDYLQVGLQGLEFCKESLVTKLLGLQDGNAFLEGKLLDRTALQDIMMAPNGFVGHRNHTDHIEALFYEAAK